MIDWELCGIGATLNDVGWICAFNDNRAWANPEIRTSGMPQADELEAMYREAWGGDPGDIAWFKALALYKFAHITGLQPHAPPPREARRPALGGHRPFRPDQHGARTLAARRVSAER